MTFPELIYIAGFAGVLMFLGWAHFRLLYTGGLFNEKAIPWLILVAAIWPCSASLLLFILVVGKIFQDKWDKEKEQKAIERAKIVAAGGSKSPYMPPYDGSLKRKRYWKKVREVDSGAVSLKSGPRSRT